MRSLAYAIGLVLSLGACGRIGFDGSASQDVADGDATGRDAVGVSQLCESTDNGLVLWYRFEESGALLVDSSKTGVFGGCEGEPCPTPTSSGAIGAAYQYAASPGDFFVAEPTSEQQPAFSGQTGITLSAYVLTSNLPTVVDATIIAKHFGGGTDLSWWIGLAGSEVQFWNGPDDKLIAVEAEFSANEIVHIAATWHPDGDLRVYQNGVNTGSFAGRVPVFDDSNITIGGWEIVSGSFLEFWDGMIDEVRIYNRALSADEITEVAGCNER